MSPRLRKELACILLFVSTLFAQAALAERKLATGIAITPKNFPRHTPGDLDDAFKLARTTGRYAVQIFQWGRYKPHVAQFVVARMRQHKMIPVLGLSPTSLDKGRKELDIPADVRRRAGAFVSFANPVVRKAFIKAAVELAKLKPEYLCLATEINFLALQRIKEYLHFVTLYKQAYHAVKRVSPGTRVFVSFQWEWVRILDSKAIHKLKEHSKLYNVFKPELDVVGLTTYPAHYHKTPRELPKDYYTWFYKHFSRNDKALFMEVGWPTSKSGNESEQVSYIKRLPELMGPLKPVVVGWSLLHDVNLKEFDADLNTTGLIYGSGKRKPAFRHFLRIGG